MIPVLTTHLLKSFACFLLFCFARDFLFGLHKLFIHAFARCVCWTYPPPPLVCFFSLSRWLTEVLICSELKFGGCLWVLFSRVHSLFSSPLPKPYTNDTMHCILSWFYTSVNVSDKQAHELHMWGIKNILGQRHHWSGPKADPLEPGHEGLWQGRHTHIRKETRIKSHSFPQYYIHGKLTPTCWLAITPGLGQVTEPVAWSG